MALTATLYRFRIDLSDIDRGVYETLDFRIAQHPSETIPYLLSRVLAFALNSQSGLEFSAGGLSDPEKPALLVPDGPNGAFLWIEIGNPSARKLHRAAKSSRTVRVYTYKDPAILLADIAANQVYHADRIEVFAFASVFLDRLGATLVRDNAWNVMHADGTLTVSVGDLSESIELVRYGAGG